MKERPTVYYEKISKHKKYCEHCGHSVLLSTKAKNGYIICHYCGYLIFANEKSKKAYEENLKRVKFRAKLRRELEKNDN